MKTLIQARQSVIGAMAALSTLLGGCASATPDAAQTSAKTAMTRYDAATRYRVSDRAGGFMIFVAYERHQGPLQTGAVESGCKQALTDVANAESAKRGHPIAALDDTTIQIAMGRNGVTETITCTASAPVSFSS